MAARTSAATERALERVAKGEPIRASAITEGINPSTLFRALARARGGANQAAKRTLIVGAGALGRELANWLRRLEDSSPIAFLDDGLKLTATEAADRGVVGVIDPDNVGDDDVVLIAIADPAARAEIAARLGHLVMQPYVETTVIVNGAHIGAGCLLLPNSLLSDGVELGQHVIVNTFSSVGHDCVVGDFCTLSSYVCLCGHVRVGDRVFFGVGAVVLPDVKIGNDAYIGAGSVVVSDVPAGGKVFGNPARAIA